MIDNRHLTFLGTCAANFSPRLNDECKDKFDMNARRSSCLLIGENYLVDCGLYCLESIRIAKVDISKITDVFITHLHADHYLPETAATLAANKATPLRLWCRRDAVIPEIPNTRVIRMDEGVSYPVDSGFSVEAVDANHDETAFPQHYVFTIDGKKLMYALDGAWFLTRSYRHLKNAHLDALIIDATCGDYLGDFRAAEHNSIPMLRILMPSLKTMGIIGDETKIYLSHIAPKLHKPHDEIQQSVAPEGWIVAYDGMQTQL